MSEWGDQREAELRDAGWSDEDIRSYMRGRAEAEQRARTPLPVAQPEQQLPSHVAAQAPRVVSRGDRGTWARTTLTGQLKAVVSPDDPEADAREMQAAREFCDRYEYTYGRRPSMTEARLAVRPPGGEGLALAGTVEEIGLVFRQAGIPLRVVQEMQALPDTVTHQVTVRR